MSKTKKKQVLAQYSSSARRDAGFPYRIYPQGSIDYPDSITYSMCKERYDRQDIANRLVKSPVQATWKDKPKVYGLNDPQETFEEAWNNLVDTMSIYHFLFRADIMAMLGRFSIVFLGLGDGANLSAPAAYTRPVSSSDRLLYLAPIPESNAEVISYEEDPMSERYGLPNFYQITLDKGGPFSSSSGAAFTKAETTTVHWSRVIHIAENTLESETFGLPYLSPVYNRLIGLEKIASGSPEMFYRGARPGYVAEAREGAPSSPEQINELKTQLAPFTENLDRWLYVEGMDIKAMSPQVASPKDHMDSQLRLISAATRIPMRILLGSERGELASSQDERAWLAYIESRRIEVAKNIILKPLIDRLILFGVLPHPADGYAIEWNSLVVLSEKERSEILLNNTKAFQLWLNSIGGPDLWPSENFFKDMGKTKEEIDNLLDKEGGE